ncbi:MAG: hypothetical protein QOD83_1360 [Solirubrobacteraceae bacterium]|jgi:hypothetical protein|nr:hypothetical protein [Solirubrobacteraceae bacterium]
MPRVAVFIDWQNAYKSARTAFGLWELPNERGNFSPYSLARILAAGNGRGVGGELVRVEIHRGLPSNQRDPVGYAANRRQSAAWVRENQSIVFPRLRPLRYDPNDAYAQPQEKGVDVQLALAVVESVLLGDCDVAVLFSNDTDLVPVVETICRLRGASRIETTSWESHGYKTRLRPVSGVHHHRLSGAIFRRVETPVNYAYQGPQTSLESN